MNFNEPRTLQFENLIFKKKEVTNIYASNNFLTALYCDPYYYS